MNESLRDALGIVHERADQAARIVSLVPSITELVCALGLLDHLVGRTGFCIHPRDDLRHVPKVGGTKDVDLDRVRALAPTHAIVNIDENRRETAEALSTFVPHLIVTHPLGPDDNPALYRLIGGIFDHADEAESLCTNYHAARARIDDAARSFATERVLYLIWQDPWMTVARDTYIARMLECVKWQTVPAEATTRYPIVDLASPILDEVDVVMLSTEPYRFTSSHAARLADQLPGKRVMLIDGEMTSWYGPRAIAGLDYLLRLRLSE